MKKKTIAIIQCILYLMAPYIALQLCRMNRSLMGEFFTASASGVYVACSACNYSELPAILQAYPERRPQHPIRYVLLYNQYLGKEHSLVLLRKK